MKGWIKQVVRAWNTAKEIAPALGDNKVSRVIAKGAAVEESVKGFVQEVKPPKP